MRHAILSLVLALMSLVGTALTAPQPTARVDSPDFRTRANAATAALFMVTPEGRQFTCTAVLIDEHTLATAKHCVTGVEDFISWIFNGDVFYQVSFSEDESGPYYAVTVLATARDDDLALLTIPLKPIVAPIDLGKETALRAGDPVFNPSFVEDMGKADLFGRFVSPKFPHLSSRIQEEFGEWKDTMPVDITVAPGASGSPLFDEKQKALIGIVVGHTEAFTVVEPVSRLVAFRNSLNH